MDSAVFQILILVFSAVFHEVAHGAAADRLGDPTARLLGRLTLNPLKHLDPIGSFLFPLGLYFFSGGAFIFGWAKPVPYNPLNLKRPDRDSALIASAGPFCNLLIAAIFGIIAKILLMSGTTDFLETFSVLIRDIIIINISLAVFNLVPIPPLDGSKVLFAFLPRSFFGIRNFLEQYGTFLLMFFIFFGFRFITPIIMTIYDLLT